MQLTRDDLERVLEQTRQSARLTRQAISLLGGLLFPPEDVEEPPSRWLLSDLWNEAAGLGLLTTFRASNALQILQEGAAECAESDGLIDLQDELARAATRLTMMQAGVPGMTDPDGTVFVYKPDEE